MKVLVCAASKYGATSEIAQAVADVLAEKGLEVSVVSPERVGAMEEFDAVVLGSAVYMGQWMKPARELAERSASALAARPVWLFSSGPVGEPPKPADNPVDVTKILQATTAHDHQIFTGRLVKKHLSFPDRAMASAIRAAEGDFRNWAEIRAWATSIADTLLSLPKAPPGQPPARAAAVLRPAATVRVPAEAPAPVVRLEPRAAAPLRRFTPRGPYSCTQP
jgi:menaquinone-dependent protoporphyrinogen oxidase